MKIYNNADELILDIVVNDNSYRNRAIMSDHNLTLYYSLPEHVEIPVGAYCEFEGERYTLMRPEHLKMKHTRLFDYTVVFSSHQDKAKIWKFRNPVDGRLKFQLTAKPKEHLQMLVDNMNRRDSGWTVGECIEDVETLISYDHDYCWDALTKQASTFKTEFEIVGKRVSLHKVEYNKSHPLPLSYGRGNGFKSGVGRSNSGEALPTEILFVQGGDRNIDRSKYPVEETLRATSSGCLLLPVGQTIGYDGEHFEDEDGYNSDNARHYAVDDLGLSIRNIDKDLSSHAEDSLDRSEDYPKRVGAISSVEVVDKDKNLYDFIDASIPEELNYEDYLIGEEQMTVIFQDGMLAGREFDVKYYHKPKTINGKNKAGRRFEIVPQEIDGIMMPGGDFVPRKGNKYAVFNIMLPGSYIRNDSDKSGASWDMFRAAVKHLFDNEQQKFSFTGELDGIWAKKDWINVGGRIRLGGFVRFTSEQFEREGVLVRITSIKDYVNNPHSPKIELSNETVSGSVSSTLKELKSTEVVIDENHRAALQFTKRRFRDAKETIEMIEAALSDNFTSRINPIAVETMSMLVGDESLQYVFTKTDSSNEVVHHSVNYTQETKVLSVGTSYLKHMTIGINSLKQNHQSSEYRRWTVAEYTSPALTEVDKSYYLYAKVSETGNSGTFTLEEEAKKMNPGDGFYYLLVGILNSEYNGERSFATLYGFTEILPGRITTDQIVSNDGQTYFNLLLGEIGGKMKFKAGTSGLENVDGYGDLTDSIQGAKDDVARLGETIIDGGYIRTNLINVDELIARHVIAGIVGGQRIELDPETKKILVVSQDGTTTVFEGNQYATPITSLFGEASGNIGITKGSGSIAASTSSTSRWEVLSSTFQTATPVEVTVNGYLQASASCARNPSADSSSGGSHSVQLNSASIILQYYIRTYDSAACTKCIDSTLIASIGANADGMATIHGTYPNLSQSKQLEVTNAKTVIPVGGHHRLELRIVQNAINGQSSGAYGYVSGKNNSKATSGSYSADYYVSRFFNNGFLLGTRSNNYILAYKNGSSMEFIMENNGHGFKFSSAGLQYKKNGGSWTSLV